MQELLLQYMAWRAGTPEELGLHETAGRDGLLVRLVVYLRRHGEKGKVCPRQVNTSCNPVHSCA